MDRLASMDVRRLRLPGGEEPAAFVAEGFRERLLGLAGLAEPPCRFVRASPTARAQVGLAALEMVTTVTRSLLRWER